MFNGKKKKIIEAHQTALKINKNVDRLKKEEKEKVEEMLNFICPYSSPPKKCSENCRHFVRNNKITIYYDDIYGYDLEVLCPYCNALSCLSKSKSKVLRCNVKPYKKQ